MKTCNACGVSKPVDQFGPRRGKCNVCRAAQLKAYKDQRREELAASARAYYQVNRTAIRARRRGEVPQNRANVARWKRENPDKVLAQINRRRARKLQASVFVITARELDRLYAMPCIVCGSRADITLDHIIPLTRGGRHSIGNLQPMCRHHNSMKGTRVMVEFRAYAWQHADPTLLGVPFTPTSVGTRALTRLTHTQETR